VSRDTSTKTKEELFGVDLDVDTKELRNSLAPPGTSEDNAIAIMECMVDAVALPGKTSQVGEEDVGSHIHTALHELIASANQSAGREDMNKDLKWRNKDRQALRGVKDEAQLVESLRDVLEVKDRILRNCDSSQRTYLNNEPWDPLLIEAWSSSGFVSTISRRSVDFYVSLLQHLILISGAYGWAETQRLIDHHTKEWMLIRANCHARLPALCHIYVALRDGADAKWLSPALEAKKVTNLFIRMAALEASLQGGGGGGGGGGSNRTPVCDKCGTMLHGTHPCFATGTPSGCKKKGQAALRRLAAAGRELPDEE
jgi:hypothetical protein